MTAPAAVWIAVGLATTVALVAMLIALVRHVMLLGRTAKRFQDEIQPIADEISAQGERAASRTASRSSEPPFGRS